MPPSVSRRAFIEWPPAGPSEPTSTLVLTSSQRRFVDIRISTNATGHATEASIEATKTHDAVPKELEWAFAGVSRSEWIDAPPSSKDVDDELLEKYRPFAALPETQQRASLDVPEERRGKVQHTVWTHTIDSRTLHPETVRDEGDMLDLPTLGLTLERGRMQNPATGAMAAYVEGWIDKDVSSLGDGDGRKEGVGCCVLEMDDVDSQAKGLVVRVGRYCQGIVRVGDSVAVERWSWVRESGWVVELRLGHLQMPTALVTRQSEWTLGEKYELMGPYGRKFVWTVVEVDEN